MPNWYPYEFTSDVAAVVHRGDLTVVEVATDFWVAEGILRRWMRQADINEGIKDGMISVDQFELVRCDERNGA